MFEAIFITLIALFIIFTVASFIAHKLQNTTIIDPLWATSIMGFSLLLLYLGDGNIVLRSYMAIGFSYWGARLGYHLILRVIKDKSEDPRYTEIRSQWKSNPQLRMFLLFMFQAGTVVLFLFPAFAQAFLGSKQLSSYQLACLVLSILGIVGEGIADTQLKRFRNLKMEGKASGFFNGGLWKYSRHPNYFFEWVFWLGMGLYPLNFEQSWSFTALITPAFSFYILNYFSGIPIAENLMAKKYGEPYQDYLSSTSAFFPLPVKKRLRSN